MQQDKFIQQLVEEYGEDADIRFRCWRIRMHVGSILHADRFFMDLELALDFIYKESVKIYAKSKDTFTSDIKLINECDECGALLMSDELSLCLDCQGIPKQTTAHAGDAMVVLAA